MPSNHQILCQLGGAFKPAKRWECGSAISEGGNDKESAGRGEGRGSGEMVIQTKGSWSPSAAYTMERLPQPLNAQALC